MAHALHAPIELADYMARETASDRRHEYVAGRIHAMTGGSMRHNRIALNVCAKLLAQLGQSPCQVFINDMKLHVESVDSIYYPDVFVWCGGARAGAQQLANDATFIVEVLSPSTAQIDQREKLAAYTRLPSLQSYAVVSQEEHRAELHLRGEDGRWSMAVLTGADDLLPTPGLSSARLQLRDLYVGTDLAY